MLEIATTDNRALLGILDSVVKKNVQLWDFYRVDGFFPDGYPRHRSKIDPNRYVAHPIHGAYFISRLVSLFRTSHDKSYLSAALSIARASIGRMNRLGNSLVFEYNVGDGVNLFSHGFYSGLTQARYLEALMSLDHYVVLKDIDEALRDIAASLCIPVSKGGILLENRYGVFLEEYPTNVPSYVLNGWLTTLNILFKFAIRSKDVIYNEICRASAIAVADNLSKYDSEKDSNSIYKLSGHLPLEICSSESDSFQLIDIDVAYPGGTYNWNFDGKSSTHANIFVPKPSPLGDGFPVGKTVSLKAMVSSMDPDTPTSFTIRLRTNRKLKMQIFTRNAELDLRSYSPKGKNRILLFERDIDRSGNFEIQFEVPRANLFHWSRLTVPFGKHIGGKFYNVYHFIHIRALSDLLSNYQDKRLLLYRDKWFNYSLQWPTHPKYTKEDVQTLPYGCESISSLPRFLRIS